MPRCTVWYATVYGTVAEVRETSATPEPVVEGPLYGTKPGDALARARLGHTEPTGTQATDTPRVN